MPMNKIHLLCSLFITLQAYALSPLKESCMSLSQLVALCEQQTRKATSPSEALKKIIAEYDVVIIKFSASWCPPCKAWSPIIRSVAAEKKITYKNDKETHLVVIEVDIDRYKALAAEFNIKTIPTAFYFAKGELVTKTFGGLTRKQTREAIEKAIERATK